MHLRLVVAVALSLSLAYRGALWGDSPCEGPPPPPPRGQPVKLQRVPGLAPGTPNPRSTPRIERPSGFTDEEVRRLQATGAIDVDPQTGAIGIRQAVLPMVNEPPCVPIEGSLASPIPQGVATPGAPPEDVPGPNPIKPNSPD